MNCVYWQCCEINLSFKIEILISNRNVSLTTSTVHPGMQEHRVVEVGCHRPQTQGKGAKVVKIQLTKDGLLSLSTSCIILLAFLPRLAANEVATALAGVADGSSRFLLTLGSPSTFSAAALFEPATAFADRTP